MVFFTYGHVRNLVLDVSPILGKHRFMFPLWILITLIGGWLILKKLGKSQVLNTFLNVFSMTMILIPLLQIGHNRLVSEQVVKRQMEEAIPLTMPENPPDIYYIILDGYTRSDVLKEIYGFDNTPFLNQLREIGFFVADCSLANYGTTTLSMASSLNMTYYDSFNDSDKRLPGFIKHNKVWSSLKALGYKTISFETEWDFLNIVRSDLYNQTLSYRYVNSFEFVFLKTTLGQLLWDTLFNDTTGNFSKYIYITKAKRDQSILEQLETVSRIPGPKIVYAHLTITHLPYLYAKEGLFKESKFYSNYGFAVDEKWDKIAYVSQIEYANHNILKVLQEIIPISPSEPVIILQGDHGANPHNAFTSQPDYIRMPILNAYLLPQRYAKQLYPNITPVNSFRLVLDDMFKGKLGLIEDKSFYFGKEYKESLENCR